MSENFCIRYSRKHLYGEISHPHRTPSGNKNHVRLLNGGLTHVSKGVEIIVYDTHSNRQTTSLCHLTGKGKRIDVSNFAEGRCFADGKNFITRGNNTDDRLPIHGNHFDSKGCKNADFLGPQLLSLKQDGVAGPDIFADLNHMLSRCHTAIHLDGRIIDGVCVLNHDNAVGTPG